MPTPVATPILVVMLQFYPGVGSAVPAPRQGNSAVMSTFYTLDDCNRDRVFRGSPQDFYCVEYRSEKIIDYTFPADKQHQGSNDDVPKVSGPQAPADPSNDIQVNGTQYKRVAGTWMPADVGPTALKDADKPFIEPLVATAVEPKAEPPKQKKVAQQSRQTQTAMFEGNPFGGLFNW